MPSWLELLIERLWGYQTLRPKLYLERAIRSSSERQLHLEVMQCCAHFRGALGTDRRLQLHRRRTTCKQIARFRRLHRGRAFARPQLREGPSCNQLECWLGRFRHRPTRCRYPLIGRKSRRSEHRFAPCTPPLWGGVRWWSTCQHARQVGT